MHTIMFIQQPRPESLCKVYKKSSFQKKNNDFNANPQVFHEQTIQQMRETIL